MQLESSRSGQPAPRPTGRSPAHKVLVAGASLLALAAVGASVMPAAQAQRADAPTIQTPFGRAPLSFADIVERVKPAVVSISVTNGGPKLARNQRGPGGPGGQGGPGLPDLPDDHPLNEFFKNLPREFRGQPGQPRQRPTLSQGSGFVISADGYVVTNNHVVDGAEKIQVSFDDQEKIDAELIGTDPRTDLALLKIKGDQDLQLREFRHQVWPRRRLGDRGRQPLRAGRHGDGGHHLRGRTRHWLRSL